MVGGSSVDLGAVEWNTPNLGNIHPFIVVVESYASHLGDIWACMVVTGYSVGLVLWSGMCLTWVMFIPTWLLLDMCVSEGCSYLHSCCSMQCASRSDLCGCC